MPILSHQLLFADIPKALAGLGINVSWNIFRIYRFRLVHELYMFSCGICLAFFELLCIVLVFLWVDMDWSLSPTSHLETFSLVIVSFQLPTPVLRAYNPNPAPGIEWNSTVS